MQKILKLTGVSVLAIMTTANANAAGYTCEELVEYTSCSPGYYMTEVDSRCPDGYYYETDICVYDEDGNAEYGYSEEECLDEEYMGGKAWYAQGCFSDDSWTYEPLADGGAVTSTCLECPAGSYCVGGTEDTAVVAPCADGTYQPEKGKASCETCPTPTLYPEYSEYLVSVFSSGAVRYDQSARVSAVLDRTYCVAQYDNLPIGNGTVSGVMCSNFGNTNVDDYSQCVFGGYDSVADTLTSGKPVAIRCNAGYYSYVVNSSPKPTLGLSSSDFNECVIGNKTVQVCQSVDFFVDNIPSCVEVGHGYFSAGGASWRAQCPVMTDDSGNAHTATTATTTATSILDCVIDLSSSFTDDKGTYNRTLNCAYDDPKVYYAVDGSNCAPGYANAWNATGDVKTCLLLTESECNAIEGLRWDEYYNRCTRTDELNTKIYYDGTNIYVK